MLPSQLQAIMEDEKTPVFVAYRDNSRVEGYIFCVVKEPAFANTMKKNKTLFVDDLCVAASAQGTGMAQKLLQYATAYAKEIGCYNITLNVWDGNRKAPGFTKNKECSYVNPRWN